MRPVIMLRNSLKNVYDRREPLVRRIPVPDDKIHWSTPWPDYNPTNFTAKCVTDGPVWADKEIGAPNTNFKWNEVDGGINRVSFEGSYEISDNGYPLNPFGRTGLSGRGYLGKWACNHAVDCLVTRLKAECKGNPLQATDPKCYQFIAIQRSDTGDWAVPGGMVDAGEDVNVALKREFMEEVLDSERMSPEEASAVDTLLTRMFDDDLVRKSTLYQGYVDDPRNTDNAWTETTCINIQCSPELEEYLRPENLKAGSDASGVAWVDIDQGVKLYASHAYFLQKFMDNLQNGA